MGLLDWLTGDLGGGGGGPSPGAIGSMGMDATQLPQPMPPEMPPPPPPQPPAGPTALASAPPEAVPMPMPRPPEADASMPPPLPPPTSVPPRGAPDASMLPPAATPTMGVGTPPVDTAGTVRSYERAGGSVTPPEAPAGATGILGRALGMDVNRERSFKGSLAAGLKSVGENYNKPGLAAFAGSAGSAMEGGQKAADTGYDQRMKSLKLAVDANAAGDKSAYNKAYIGYLGRKQAADADKAAGGGKGAAWNKPDSQKFLDAQRGVSQDPTVRASLKKIEALSKPGGDPQELAAAEAAHKDLVSSTEQKYLAGVGLDPKKALDLVKNPPGSQGNPHTVTSKEDFDIYVKPGQAYINPADGKVYVRKGADGAASAGGAPTPPAAPQPPRIPTQPTSDDEE